LDVEIVFTTTYPISISITNTTMNQVDALAGQAIAAPPAPNNGASKGRSTGNRTSAECT
jgi:hypothetical protein